MSDQKFTDIGAGWKKKTKNGDPIISISVKPDHGLDLSECWVSLMINKRKGSNPKAPDFILSATPKDDAKPKAPPAQQQSNSEDEFGF